MNREAYNKKIKRNRRIASIVITIRVIMSLIWVLLPLFIFHLYNTKTISFEDGVMLTLVLVFYTLIMVLFAKE